MFDTLAQLDKEIERLKNIKARCQWRHTIQARIDGLKSLRLKFTHPLRYKIKQYIGRLCHQLGDWILR